MEGVTVAKSYNEMFATTFIYPFLSFRYTDIDNLLFSVVFGQAYDVGFHDFVRFCIINYLFICY